MYLPMQRTYLAVAIALPVLATPVLALSFPSAYALVSFVGALRWIAIAALVAYAWLRPSLTKWIFVAMFLGAELGHDFPAFAIHLRLLAQIFLRLIKVIIAPLIFATLCRSIAGHSDLKKVGRMGLKSIIYFEIVTTLALFIGLAAINIGQAGTGAQIPTIENSETVKVQALSLSETILHVFPENIAKSVAEDQILQVVVFSILFGIAMVMVKSDDKRRPMLAFAESLTEVMFKFTNIVMLFAPFGVMGGIAYTVASTGIGILANLARLLLTLYVALFAVLIFVLLPAALIAKVPLRRFIQAVAEPTSIAFGTASSEAALPRAMELMEELGVPRSIVAFVMPTGYSFNLIGSALYLSVASVFIAQAGGLHLSPGRQLYIMLRS